MKPLAQEVGRLVQPSKRKKRLEAMAAAGLARWPADLLRHSSANYRLAMHGDMNATALELGYMSTTMLFTNYQEAVKPDVARQWWALIPGKLKRQAGK